jgi:peptidoglycan/xylan/chitin deacetylase (PgdA/CDA1 family)
LKTSLLIIVLIALASSAFAEQKIFSERTTFPFDSSGQRLLGVSRNTIYITIDDGPTNGVTDEILDILSQYGVPATFFVLGARAKSRSGLLRRMFNEGHLVASHSYSHLLDFPTRDYFINSLMTTHEIITPYISQNNLFLYRAPGGVWNNWRADTVNSHPSLQKAVGPIYWNVGGGSGSRNDNADWKCWKRGVSSKSCALGYLQGIYRHYSKNRATILLMHDINTKSATMLKIILENLKQDTIDWKFELIDEIPSVRDYAEL